MKTQLIIPSIEGDVHLGCLPEERERTQKVKVAIKVGFSSPPNTCESDDIKETPCYAEMAQILAMTFKEKHYRTIEHLGLVSYQQIQKYLKNYDNASKVQLRIDKVKPPVDSITSGCQFSLEGQV